MKRNNSEETKGTGDFHFHYRREDRIALAPKEVKELYSGKKIGFFKKNRGLLILLIDIALIVVIYIIISTVFVKDHASATVSGYRITLKAFVFEDRIMTSLTVAPKNVFSRSSDTMLNVHFYTKKHKPQVSASDLLPELGTNRILRAVLLYDPSDVIVYADVTINGKTETLSVRARAE